ncbi:LLM class flavin-dependent oxidoreductase [Paractinoplanes toevensis]|uniref:Monooxygenase n=1 Tax=Paractinoplanes toevensis TaxID=571911 RepID=A0A919W3B7_9ACTN|nr:LLM class flavin-dependent oxidoreductase [Actinoplanes toevensis]GIM92614.1 monooxygenase [Actinoplanes toevensis]
MEIGIGLPAHVPGATGSQLVEWASRSEARGFASLAAIDRLVFDNYEPLVALAAAAAVTSRIRLVTAVVIAPSRANPAVLAKQVASLNLLSGGRLTLGLAPGGRADDYLTSPVPFRGRGKAFDTMLTEMSEVWTGAGGIGPLGEVRPRLILGGFAPRSFRRAARWGDGWIGGANGPEGAGYGRMNAHQAWQEAGRTDRPWVQALVYFGLGSTGADDVRRYLDLYYAFSSEVAAQVMGAAITGAAALPAALETYAAAGVDELIMLPASADPAQVELLADVLDDRLAGVAP